MGFIVNIHFCRLISTSYYCSVSKFKLDLINIYNVDKKSSIPPEVCEVAKELKLCHDILIENRRVLQIFFDFWGQIPESEGF